MNKKIKKTIPFKTFFNRWKIEIICIFILLFAGSAVIFAVFTIFGTQPLVFAGGDFAFHVSRLLGTLDALKDGQIIPQIAPHVHNGLGMGFNIFYGQIFSYFATFLYILLRSWPVVINIIFCLLYLGIGVSCWYSVRRMTNSNFIGLISGLALMLATGNFTGYYYIFAGFTPGMAAVFIGLPLLIAGIYGVLQDQKKSIRLILIGACFLILNSVLGSVISLIVAGTIALCYWKQLFTKKHIKAFIVSLLIVLGATAFYTLPMLEAKNATTYAAYVPGFMSSNRDTAASVLPVTKLFNYTYSNYDTNQGLPLHFLLAFIGAMVLLIILYRKKHHKEPLAKLTLSLTITALIGLILIGPIIPWQNVPLSFTIFQYSGRFNLVFLFPASILLGIIANEIRKNAHFCNKKTCLYFSGACVATLFCLSWIGISYPNSKMITGMSLNPEESITSAYDSFNDSKVTANLSECDYLPISLVYYFFGENIDLSGQNSPGSFSCRLSDLSSKIPTEPKITSGQMQISNFAKQGTHESMEISNNVNGGIIELPATYYPGYKATLNDISLTIQLSQNGLIEVIVPENQNGILTLHYGLSTATIIGNIISIFTITGCIIFGAYKYRQQKTTIRSNKS